MIVASSVPTSWFAIATIALVVGGALVGLIFRGAAEAWRSERDAAVEKSERLEERVAELEKQVDLLRLTNVAHLQEQMTSEHAAMLEALHEISKEMHGNTTAMEMLIRNAFPAAIPARG